jgi:hypothetical protein
MYALIYDDFDVSKPNKEVISVHKSRETAERALAKRRRKLGLSTLECHTRIVWTDEKIRIGNYLMPGSYDTWAPNEKIPESEKVPDGD